MDARRLFSNAVFSIAQVLISAVVLFVLYRYLIARLGAEQLGLWSLVLASTSLAKLSDMGLTFTVVKFVARYRALKQNDQACEVIQTAFVSIAVVLGIGLLAAYPLLDDLLGLAIPASNMPQALAILPCAVWSFWLASIGGVFQSGLDGCQRMDLRNVVVVTANLLYMAGAFILVPSYALVGLAIAQVAQALFVVLASSLALRRQLPHLRILQPKWSKAKFTEMFRYALAFQVSSVAALCLEPATKLLMGRYGGLANAGFYEMASQYVLKLRALLVSANQVVIPAVAEVTETSSEKLRDIYLMLYNLLFFLTIPFYAAILLSLPIMSYLWIGHVEEQFVAFGVILTIGWGLNTLNSPAYFLNAGTGHLKWNVISQVTAASLNVPLAMFAGLILGGLGVAIGSMTALAVASWTVVFELHRRYSLNLRHIVPGECYGLLVAATCCVAVSAGVGQLELPGANSLGKAVAVFVIYIVIMGMVMWRSPYGKQLYRRFRQQLA